MNSEPIKAIGQGRTQRLRLRISGLGLRVGLGFRVWGLGFRV